MDIVRSSDRRDEAGTRRSTGFGFLTFEEHSCGVSACVGASVEASHARILQPATTSIFWTSTSHFPEILGLTTTTMIGPTIFPTSGHTLCLRPGGETRVHVRPLTLNKFIWTCVVRVSKFRGKDVMERASRKVWRARELEKDFEALRPGRGRDSGMGVLPLTHRPKRPDAASTTCCFAISCGGAIAFLTIDVFIEIERWPSAR